MKLNLSIIYGHLKSEYKDIVLASNDVYSFPLENALIYQKNKKLQNNILYVVEGSIFESKQDLFNGINKIVIGSKINLDINNTIFINDNVDLSDLYLKIVNIFVNYDGWNQKILNHIALQDDLNVLCKTLGEKLTNPACILNLSFQLQGIIGEIPKDQNLTGEWKDLLLHHESPIETFNIPKDNIYFFTNHSKEIYKPEGSPYGNKEIFLNIFVHNNLFAILADSELVSPFSDGEYSTLILIREYLEKYFTAKFKLTNSENNIQYYLNLLLKDQEIDKLLLKEQLSFINWSISDSCYVCSITSTTHSKKEQLEHAISRIQKALNNTIAFVYVDRIILLSKVIDINKLEKCLEKIGMICGISFLQKSIFDIKTGYNQSLYAIKYGLIKNPNSLIYRYEDSYAIHLKDSLSPNVNIIDFIPPDIRYLAEYDKKHETDYLNILKIYLLSGENSKKASELLFKHRNTLIYRIQKIQKIINHKIEEYKTSEIEILLLGIWLLVNSNID